MNQIKNNQQNYIPPLKDTIHKYNFLAKKSLGQHFLLDPRINQQIIDLAGDLTNKNVIEVGPGPGSLTRAILASNAKTVTGVEIDRRAIYLLRELQEFYPHRFTIIEKNALDLDLTTLCPKPRQLIANLPYNISTSLLLNWLKQATKWERLTLMFQQEVAYRICAAPSTEHYSRLSIISQWIAQCSILKKIPPGAFSPPPKIYSAVIQILPHKKQPSTKLFKSMEIITAAAFGKRRKMLRSSLKSINGITLLQKANIDEKRRAETLTINEFDLLARLYHEENLK